MTLVHPALKARPMFRDFGNPHFYFKAITLYYFVYVFFHTYSFGLVSGKDNLALIISMYSCSFSIKI